MDSDCKIEILTKKDEPQVRKLIYSYLENEVTAQCVRLTDQEKVIFVNTYIEKVVPQRFSLGAFDKKNGNLLACAFHSDGQRRVTSEDYAISGNTPGLDKLLRFDEYMEKETDQLVGNGKLLMGEIVVVDPKFGRKGLSAMIYERYEELAKFKGFTLLIAVVNSAYSRAVLRKYGFVIFKEVLYADYRDPVTGEAIFRHIPKPHIGAALVYKRLTPSKL